MLYSVYLSPLQYHEVQQLARYQSLIFELDGDSYIAIKCRKGIHIYQNRCPHQNKRLAESNGCDESDSLLECQHHGAQFLPSTGECVSGPCLGQKLNAYSLKEDLNGFYLEAIT